MLRRVLLALCALALATVQAHAQLLPGRAPGFKPGFQFLSSWAMPGAVYDADFAQGLYTAGPPSVTRASQGYAADSSGTYALFGNDTLRRTNAGLTDEPADTNSIRNSAMQGAVPGILGAGGSLPTFMGLLGAAGLTVQVFPTANIKGIDCLLIRFSGTASGNFSGIVVDAGLSGLTASTLHTISTFLQVAGGNNANISTPRLIFRYNLSPSGFSDIPGIVDFTTGSFKRFEVSGSTSGAITGTGIAFIQFNHNVGSAIDITLAIGSPQLEPKASSVTIVGASSPIRTAAGVAARGADAVTLPVTGIGRVVVTYDDGSTQTFTGISTATPWTIPAANLNRSVIRRLTGYAS